MNLEQLDKRCVFTRVEEKRLVERSTHLTCGLDFWLQPKNFLWESMSYLSLRYLM